MSLSPLTPGSLLQRVRPAREPGWRVQGATPGPAPAPRAGSSPRHPRPPAGHTGRRHRQVIVGVRKGKANTEASRGPASGAGAVSLPGAGAVANETNADRGRREERHDSRPAPSGPGAPGQAGPPRGAARPKGRRACRWVDARRLRLPSRGLRGNRSGAEGVITGSESEGGRQTTCFGSSRVFESNGICWIPVPFSPSFEQADMCPIHTPLLRHPGDLAGRCRRFLLDWDEDDAGSQPRKQDAATGPRRRRPRDGGKVGACDRGAEGPTRCGHSAPQNGPAPPPFN